MTYKKRYNPFDRPAEITSYQPRQDQHFQQQPGTVYSRTRENEGVVVQIDGRRQEERKTEPTYIPSRPPRKKYPKPNMLKAIKADDLVLLAVLYLLFSQEEKDMTLILALGFLFICEYVDLENLLDYF